MAELGDTTDLRLQVRAGPRASATGCVSPQRLALLARAALSGADGSLRRIAAEEARSLAAAAAASGSREGATIAAQLAALFAGSAPLPGDTAMLVSQLGAALDGRPGSHQSLAP